MIERFKSDMATFFEALNLRTKRQELLASNIANADTPYYKARDIDFQSELKKALNPVTPVEEGGALQLSTTNENHLTIPAADLSLKYHQEFQSAVDQNTVEMDVERTKFIENSLQYQILTQFISQKIQGLKDAMANNQ